MDSDGEIVTKFLKSEVICRFGVPNYTLTNNGIEWSIKFDQICKNYGISHQYMTLQWPRCNGMVGRLIKTLKHGLIVFSTTPEHAQDQDEQLPKILFGYHCRIQANIQFSPYMVLIHQMTRLKVGNFLNPLVQTFDIDEDFVIIVEQMISKF